ncbi:osmotically inducible protein C, putative ATP/GTP binding protein [Fulvimarina pelagi HTCC2506]|uniref:Osmotically inducible protein, OsmC n=2 Tax=Fulvimarina pelagi TaxID=217511 RepID=A0A0P0Z8R9_9HYPH|nr:OsmC family protein [Fulvimarina pelagi]EAU41032.1 osmotically inducible protein C, putative ATP/GTP binding protein [Fulvimarina pelagi HTCC2506]BAT30952.1 osmotically inducible protein, OsmC [Fulvimarina pelagi]
MKRQAIALWKGALADGKGHLTTQSGALENRGYSFKSRFEDESGQAGTNPEELLAAAHAGCFAMQLSHMLAESGSPADELNAKSVVDIQQVEGGFAIKTSAITLEAKVPGIDEAKFKELATKAKEGCPVSKALSGVEITLDAKLV